MERVRREFYVVHLGGKGVHSVHDRRVGAVEELIGHSERLEEMDTEAWNMTHILEVDLNGEEWNVEPVSWSTITCIVLKELGYGDD